MAETLAPDPPPETWTYLTDDQAERLCDMFAAGLESGLGYGRIFNLMKESGLRDSLVERLRTAILEEGAELGEALSRFGILDPAARRLVAVAEKQSTLPQTFGRLAELYASRYERKRKLIYALIEPFVLIGLGFFVLGELLTENIVDIALSADAVTRLADLVATGGLKMGLFLLSVFALLYAWLNLPVNTSLRGALARLWMRLPVVGRASYNRSLALFCRYLEQSITNGFDLLRSLKLATAASNNPRIHANLDAITEQIEKGDTLADALSGVGVFPREMIEYVKAGEETGRLDDRLDGLARRFDERADEQFERRMNAFTHLVRYVIMFGVVGYMLWELTHVQLF